MKNSMSESYAKAGVDITAGYKAVELMKAHIARTMTTLSQAQIGKALNRDRTTVISSEGVIKEEIERNSDFAMEVRELIRSISSGI